MEIADYLVVGSGCTGAAAAENLCSKGKQVLMIDTALRPQEENIPDQDFITLRTSSDKQSDIFLGAQFEALQAPAHQNIPQQTAQRKFMTNLTDKLIPLVSDNFFPVESLALGGLGNGWGLGSYTFSDKELLKAGLNPTEMKKAYAAVAKTTGISGQIGDDASAYCHGDAIPLQQAIDINPCAASLLHKYQRKKASLNKKGIYLGRPSLALLTENREGRSAYQYKDLDFYYNEGNSAYRPSFAINNLIKKGKLQFAGGLLALRFIEHPDFTELECLNINSKEKVSFKAKKLILACGTLGTARIVLRSFESSQQLPVLCNAYTYMPFIHLPFLGRKNDGKASGFAQLALFYDINKDHSDVAMASIYNYRSLLHFRILQQIPLNFADGLKLLRLMVPSLGIAGIFHPAQYTEGNYVQLQSDSAAFTGEKLQTHYTYPEQEEKKIKQTEKQIAKAISALNCLVLKKVRTPTGSSIHYSGTLPFSTNNEKFSVSPKGKLYGTENVYIADGSGFKYLPGKGLTLSLMAYAHYVTDQI